MHGAVLSAGGSGVMFTAPSGTGKTTHAQLWLSQIPDCHMVNGDKPLIRFDASGPIACGTPWCGKEKLGRNEQVPLRAICYVQRADHNRLVRVAPSAIWPLLLKQVYLPKGPAGIGQVIPLFNRLCTEVPLYRLECNMDPEAALTAYQTLRDDHILK